MHGKTQPNSCHGGIETLVQISLFIEKLWSKDPFPVEYALASLGHSLIIVKCEMSWRDCRLSPDIWASKKVDFWAGHNSDPIFYCLWTKVYEIRYTCTGVVIVCNVILVCWFTIFCFILEIFTI